MAKQITSTRALSPEEMTRLSTGRVTVKPMSWWHPRLKEFRTKYAAKARGVLLKTKRGLYFKSPAAALEAGRECLRSIKRRSPALIAITLALASGVLFGCGHAGNPPIINTLSQDVHSWDDDEMQMIKTGVTNMPAGYSIMSDGAGNYAIKTDEGILLDSPVFTFKDKSFAPIRAWRIKHVADGIAASHWIESK